VEEGSLEAGVVAMEIKEVVDEEAIGPTDGRGGRRRLCAECCLLIGR
jgi:hypothetical protein